MIIISEICKKEKFKDCEVGTIKKVKTKNGREITFERINASGKNKNLISKIISNKKI